MKHHQLIASTSVVAASVRYAQVPQSDEEMVEVQAPTTY
jgi:hypothetical protein